MNAAPDSRARVPRTRHLLVLALVALTCPCLVGAQARRATESASVATAPADWLGEVSARIHREEYEFSPLGAELWSAPNRSHELRSRFDRDGLEVFPRDAPASGSGAVWKLRIGTGSFGRVGDVWPVESRAASVERARAEIRYGSRHGALLEWFVNDERGIEQGWTISERPRGVGSLVLGLSIDGDLSLRLDDGGRSGVFVDGAGEARVRYTGLVAWDATGRGLTTRMRPGPAGVEIRVDDSHAVYPITVDPLMTSAAWTAESNQAFARFACSVSTAGDVNGDGYSDVIVGARRYDNGQRDEGRAFVYHGSPTGLSTTEAWTAESNQVRSEYGFSVSTAGDVDGDGYSDVIVGAYWFTNGESREGRAFVYHGSANGLLPTATWTAEPDQASASFGRSVSVAGDVNGDGYSDVVVGATTFDNGESNEGRAFVYHGSPTGLGASAAWTAESDQANASFGHSVSAAGDVNGDGYGDVLVGAINYDNGEFDEGRAFLYRGSPTGLDATESWTAEADQAQALFGYGVSTAGDVNGDGYADVIVGALNYTTASYREGRAYVYHGSAAGLAATEAWTAEADQDSASFGRVVAGAGDVNGDGYSDVVVGAETYDNGETDEGRAYVYQGSPTGLATTEAWTAESNQAGANFGHSVSLAGDVDGDGYSDVLIGANLYDNGEENEGRAFVYRGSAAGLSATDGWTGESDQAGAQFGVSVATAGDVNGDGYSDVIVGAYLYDNGESGEGRAYVYLGSAGGLDATEAWTAESNQVDASFGASVASAGDVDGDGYSDVIVGAGGYDNGETDEGRAYVYLGSPVGLGTTAAWTAESDQPSAGFGFAVSTAGDVNGDGYSDVVVGAANYDNGEVDEGRAYVYHGSATGLGTGAAWTAESNQALSDFGLSASTAGDVNGDGYSDVIVGAGRYDNGESGEGRAFVYHGSATGLGNTEAWTAESNQADAWFGGSVATAGDVNGDGYSDVIIGAFFYDNGEVDEGRAYVYHGSEAGLCTAAAWTAESNQPGGAFGILFGFSVSTAGDVNGDGYSDVIVGAAFYDNGEFQEGRAFVYHGSATGLGNAEAWTAESNQRGAVFGASVATAGDVNGDGYSDVIVGAIFYDSGESDEGGAFLYYGNDGDGGLVRGIQQRRADDSAPIALLGLVANDPGSFALRASFPHALAGVCWADPRVPTVYLEWEIKRLGEPFTGTGLERSPVGQTVGVLPQTLVFDELAQRSSRYAAHKWRARFVFEGSPLYPRTPWFSLPGNAVTETKLRFPTTEGSATPASVRSRTRLRSR